MTISIDGLVSGLDTSAIIESLIELEEKPIKLKEDKQSILAKEKTAWEKIKEKLLLLEKSADKLDSRRDFSSYSGKFINHNPTTGSVLTVAANSSANVGSYDIAVSNLAKRQKSVSDQSYADKNVALGIAGSLTINDGADHTINITTDMTIEDVKDKINQSAANIVATISNSGSELAPAYQIILTSDDEGIANSFTTTVSLTSGSLAFNVTTPAEDAILTLDGIAVTKSSNSIDDLIEEVTIRLETIGTGQIKIEANSEDILDKINQLVDAYN
ncbi:MAG: flagellar filament capping protein FliD, partial [Nitrospinota bacterium]